MRKIKRTDDGKRELTMHINYHETNISAIQTK